MSLAAVPILVQVNAEIQKLVPFLEERRLMQHDRERLEGSGLSGMGKNRGENYPNNWHFGQAQRNPHHEDLCHRGLRELGAYWREGSGERISALWAGLTRVLIRMRM